MRISIHHVPTGNKWTSDAFEESKAEKIHCIIKEAMRGELNYLKITVKNNDLYLPDKILSECAISIVE